MSEAERIQQSPAPVTVASMKRDLENIGVRKGDVLLVHSALSSLGWVCGGPQAVIQALEEAVGPEGTLVMPSHSGDLSDPAQWQLPPVPESWVEEIYATMPAYDPARTPTRGMGRIAELFRTIPGTLRSSHPQVSFSARGPEAEAIVGQHALTPQFGDDSPIGKLYQMDAKILLLGVGYDSCTSFHLAETRLESMPVKRVGTPMMEEGQRVWKWFEDYAYDCDDFPQAAAGFEATGQVVVGKVGLAECRVFSVWKSVDAVWKWLVDNRVFQPE